MYNENEVKNNEIKYEKGEKMKKTFLGLGTIVSIGAVIPMTISCGTKDENVVKIETYKNKAAFEKEYKNKAYVLEDNKGNLTKVSFNDFKNDSATFYKKLNFSGKNETEKSISENDKVFVILGNMEKVLEDGTAKKADEIKKSFQKTSSEKKVKGLGVLLIVWKTSKGNVYSNIQMSNINAIDMQKNYEAKLSAIEKVLKS